MELTTIEMVAYQVAHRTEAEPWRCVLCERLTPVSDRWILVHLDGEHGLERERLTIEKDGVFLYPPAKEEDKSCN